LLLSGFQNAPVQARAPAAAQQSAAEHARPALWVVADKDTTIYLFGTIHLLKPGISWFEAGVRKAFDASSELVMEVTDQADAGAQARILQYAVTPDGPPLTSQLPEPAREKLLALLAENGLPPAAFERMKPWFAAITLTALPLRKLGFDPRNGVEETLRTAAQQANKPMIGLETSEQQLALFDGLSQKSQIALLVETIEEQSTLEQLLEKMIGAWSAGDPLALAQTLNGEMADDPELRQRLLLDRNAHWAEWIKARLDRPGTVFLAVGAGHLAGPGSVQDMLAARRIESKRIENR
jgi:uncharacterized protein YbaP (TraB family)